MDIVRRILLCFIGSIVVIIAFMINFDSQLARFQSEATFKEASIDEYVKIMGNFVDTMTIYADEYLSKQLTANPALISRIQHDRARDTYNMDTIRGSAYEINSGNLTGMGAVPTNAAGKTEMSMALELGKYFGEFSKQIPEVTWLYYVSDSDFIYLYPWVSSSEFTYTRELKTQKFYTSVMPQNFVAKSESFPSLTSPEGTKADAGDTSGQSAGALGQALELDRVWTPAYLDLAGKGLMVTLSSPIYRNETFTGVLSLDLSTKKLGELISSDYQSYLIDDRNSVIAAGSNVKFDWNEIKFDELSGLSKGDIERVNLVGDSKVELVGNNLLYTDKIQSTPWTFFVVVSIWSIVEASLLYSTPIIVVSILLIVTWYQSEKRKRTEAMLNKSLAENKSYQALLENSATHDFLTDTCNRRGLAESFEHYMRENRQKDPVCFIIGDIDEFKHFNDTFGHNAGDKVLVELANLMKASVGPKDVVCRWGGEEFVIMLAGKSYDDGLAFAGRLRRDIEAIVIVYDQMELHTTMTLGVAQYDVKYNMKSAVSEADSALYLGKKRGRNRVVGWQEVVDFPGIPPVSPELVSE